MFGNFLTNCINGVPMFYMITLQKICNTISYLDYKINSTFPVLMLKAAHLLRHPRLVEIP